MNRPDKTYHKGYGRLSVHISLDLAPYWEKIKSLGKKHRRPASYYVLESFKHYLEDVEGGKITP